MKGNYTVKTEAAEIAAREMEFASEVENEAFENGEEKTRGGFSGTFVVLTAVFVVCLLVANLIEIKTVPMGWFTITAGVVVFPISYVINDCVVEVYGFRKARLMIWTGFAMSLLVSILLQLAIALPGTAEWHGQEAMETVYGAVPRIMAASFAAFLAGSFANAYVMSVMRRKADSNKRDSRKSFSARAIISTLWGEGIDSLVFFPIAFGGVLPWKMIGSLMVTQIILKTSYEVVILPVTLTFVAWLRKRERLALM